MALGLSFMPGTMGKSQRGTQPAGSTPGSVSPLQEAIQLLSLRLPSKVQNSIAPQALLTAPGGMGLPGVASGPTAQALEQLKRILGIRTGSESGEIRQPTFDPVSPQNPTSQRPASPAPSGSRQPLSTPPRVVPGDTAPPATPTADYGEPLSSPSVNPWDTSGGFEMPRQTAPRITVDQPWWQGGTY